MRRLAIPFAAIAVALLAAVSLTPAQAAAVAPAPDAPIVTVSVRHRGPDLASVIEIRLTPQNAAGNGELYLSMIKPTPGGYLKMRRVLTPATRGVYLFEYRFPEEGNWEFYLRYGPGQAGYSALTLADISPRVGGVDTFTSQMRRGYFERVPGWVQPLGYAAFGLLAALALAGVAAIMHHLRQIQSPARPD